MACEKVGVAYPVSEDEHGPFVAAATAASTAEAHHEPEIFLTGLIRRRTTSSSGCLEHADSNGGAAAFDLPDAARGGITWNDPLYTNNPDIIAAFDFNWNMLRELYDGRRLVAWFFLIASILLGLVLSFAVESGSVCWFFLWMPISGSIVVVGLMRKEVYMVGRRHVAVARRGVYLDETDESGSSHLARRTVLKFDSIVSCSIHETGWTRPHYNVVILTPNPNKPTNPDPNVVVPEHISHNVTGLRNGQAFVDLVSAMMEAASNTGPNPADRVQDSAAMV
jgi:hypothetical protein